MSQTFLHVEYREKDEVKRLGAHWNGFQWYVPAGCNLTPFARWLPVQESPAAYRLDETPVRPVDSQTPWTSAPNGAIPVPPPSVPADEPIRSSENDVFVLIERLADLHAKGILSSEEFAAKKAELLSRI
jgi:hypothetical protein